MRYLILCCVLVWGTAAMAAGLSQDEADRFIDSLSEATTLGNEIQESPKAAQFSIAMAPIAGRPYAPYARGVIWMKMEMPEHYKTMAKIAKKHGFATAEDWASTGDRVMGAFMAIEMEGMSEEARRTAEQTSPEMLDNMPANIRAQIEGTRAMLAMIKTIPAEDIELLRALAPRMREQLSNR